jgi:hypothetical protein
MRVLGRLRALVRGDRSAPAERLDEGAGEREPGGGGEGGAPERRGG